MFNLILIFKGYPMILCSRRFANNFWLTQMQPLLKKMENMFNLKNKRKSKTNFFKSYSVLKGWKLEYCCCLQNFGNPLNMFDKKTLTCFILFCILWSLYFFGIFLTIKRNILCIWRKSCIQKTLSSMSTKKDQKVFFS